MKKTSIVIPVLNEEEALRRTLDRLEQFTEVEMIVVDGGSTDETVPLLQAWSDRHSTQTRSVLYGERGRARQMNAGAERATGEILLFLHADSLLPAGAIDAVAEAVRSPAVAGGAFRLKIDSEAFFLRIVEKLANLRSRFLKLPYGDQGIFVRRDLFERLGGYAELPLMEDVDFIRRLKREGEVVLLAEEIATSPRRWLREGIYYVTLRNLVLLALYFGGVSPGRLARWYPFGKK
ncbi:TIGR04283 family arsenosugar biosynthesis glycosyltransferase [Candidatus Manganitrophus noduliformans]|uniref:Glycosyltransferase n=1 Tax=Candidatus Manganitrophus noduliformans TaxID=2606439 RepID=A0A7X6DMF9_9BACT|nr:TIGR04283 family arsenosugar biosynthesis glycosyltransferase [Candidatus Manganitrophus noduliformans]NKE69931.1 glycosyltransferase [Candidatus Manganitrophus noduliformans]